MGGGESTVFAGYRIFGRIAGGGMASVYLGQEDGGDPDEWLAIKRVHPHLVAREDVRHMFLNEAQILSRLDHPNICGILSYGIHDDSPYLVMRYLHGAPLSGLLRRLIDLDRPLPVDLMTYVIAATADGLHYAHDAVGEDGQPLDLVHRDISPQNIFVTFSGEVKLLDFGVAKAAGFDGYTRTGHIKGKYAYMSPEQAEGLPVDRRSDVFSLGIVLWESFTGRHLFKRSREIDTLRAIANGIIPPPSQLNPAVPEALDRILKRTMQARRERRYQSAAALSEVLWSYLTTTPRPVGSDEVAETLSDVFGDHPPPIEMAHRMATQPEAVPLVTSPGRLPLPDLEEQFIEEATLAAQRALEEDTDDSMEDPLDAPTGEEDLPPSADGSGETVAAHRGRLGAALVAPADSDTGDLRLATEIAESPPDAEDDDLDLLTNLSPDNEAPELIPWHADRANQAPTIADPRLADEVKRAMEALATDSESAREVSPHVNPSFTDRPRVQPHPFDAGDQAESPVFESEQQDTLTDDPGPPGGVAKVVTTIPKDEISDLVPDLVDLGPRIEPPPPSLIDDPRQMSFGEQIAAPPTKATDHGPKTGAGSRGRTLLVAGLLLFLAAIGVVVLIWAVDAQWSPLEVAPTSEE